MGPPPTKSPVTGNPVPEHYIHASSLHFQDTKGRNLLLRGVNLSGMAKNARGQPSHVQERFWEDGEAGTVSYLDQPLNLEDGSADEHLARLRAWGYNMLRYVFTWEALEHEGPGKYDVEYMDYVVKVLYKCKEWGFRVFMDPHQDVWSRFSGGSGAPLWTLYACGIDPQGMNATAGALVHCDYPTSDDPHPAQFPGMIWGTNYTRAVCETIFTLFFGGKVFAPKCVIDGKNIQDWLQDHFIGAVAALAKRISDAGGLYDECVVGWDSMNEPGEGMIGQKDIGIVPADRQLKKGTTTSPIQGMRLGMGQKQEVVIWDFGALGPKQNGTQVIDPKGRRLWLSAADEQTRGGGKWGWKRGDEWEMGTCIWAQHGVWDPITGDLLRPDYFNDYRPESDPTRGLNFVEDFFKPHWIAYAERIRAQHPEAIHFIQSPVMKPPPHIPESYLKGRACSSCHYYDGLTLMTKHWNWFNADALGMLRGKYWSVVQAIRIGESAIRNCIQGQLGVMKQDTEDVLGKYPTLIGEIGCPYDMDDKRAYGYVDGGKGEGDYSAQQKAWDCSMNALEGPNALNFTLWTYVPDNSHEWGDLWNGEDLSIWSKDDMELPNIDASQGSVPEHDRSSVSVATSTTVTSDMDQQTHTYTPTSVQSGSGVTADLITNGARAVGAVCRPFPVTTVGTIKRADFDLATSAFKLSLTVRADDPQSSSTELYIPFVHYAKSLSVSTQEHYTDSTSKPAGQGLELDIDVRLTHGSYTTQGQYLTWTYPLPSPAQRETTYTIEIKRRGGPIRRVQESAYAQAAGTWSDVCGGCTIA